MTINWMTLTFALRNLTRQKGRTGMTLASIVFGVVGLILSGGFVEDVFIQLREATIHSRLGHLQVYREGFYAQGSKDPYAFMIDDATPVENKARALPGVVDTMKRLNFFGLLNNGKTDLPIIGEGVEPAKEAALGSFFFIIEGRQLTDDDAYGVLLGEGVARSLKLEVGSFVTVLANTPDGALNSLEFEVVGVFRTFSKDYDARAIRVALPAAQELLAVGGVHAVVVSLADTLATDTSAEALRSALGGDGYELKTWFELDDFYASTVELYKSQLGVLQFIILIVVLLSVANSVSMTAYERVGEFGTLKALGKRDRDISRLIILENSMLGFIGAALGAGLGVGLAIGISAIGIPMPPPPNANVGYTALIRVVPDVVLVSFLIGFIATVLSAIFAARGAARVPVVEALRQNI